MSQLVVGFWGEGFVEEHFLMRIVERTLFALVPHVEVIITKVDAVISQSDYARLGELFIDISGMSLFIYHRDADSSSEDKTLQLITDALVHLALSNVVPIIPIRSTEAWMMADSMTFETVVGLPRTSKDFPNQPHQVEAINNPKQIIDALLHQATAGRQAAFMSITRQLGDDVRLSLLGRVPAYQRFRERLRQALIALHFEPEE